jgi:heterotetrameric sarcosine oxidase delta subunit
MRIPCPFCGLRDAHEFSVRGEAGPARPDPTAPDAEARFVAYLYERDNPRGPDREHWYHAAGCRRWLTVVRDTLTHEVIDARLAREASQ